MNACSTRLHRRAKPRRECARDSVADVDQMHINVQIDNHSDLPLEHWQDRLKRQRRKIGPRPAPPEPSSPPGRQPPDSIIDEYAAALTDRPKLHQPGTIFRGAAPGSNQ